MTLTVLERTWPSAEKLVTLEANERKMVLRIPRRESHCAEAQVHSSVLFSIPNKTTTVREPRRPPAHGEHRDAQQRLASEFLLPKLAQRSLEQK
jgi:hypothetical protein